MINLEWLRTFRAVYKTKSLSKASELLMISQPTVSQQISTLEAHLDQKLFIRKSKGVIETDDGRLLNTLIAGSIESLEIVENLISQKHSQLRNIITIGISPHLYKTILCHQILALGEYVHIRFGERQQLIRDVEEGSLLFAIIPGELDTFDTFCFPLYDQKVVLVGTPDIDYTELGKLYRKDPLEAEQWLVKHKWYAHDSASSFIKLYWLHIFDKKRPAIVPNYVVPNEYEVLYQLSQGSGLSVALDGNVTPFTDEKSLWSYELKKVVFRKLSLISNKKKAPKEATDRILEMLRRKAIH
ncbi:LysR family transcriptional regulator [Fulvivirgaceae bacterium BMA10]|uniref:LysR family transcriptional regulator n=1 Tax=Splendidivirga corallicola TaxID=3051826 RepID=A0ABT8KME4_9BACT|nr:LysR family transcriptional regulator [Fulvivirgaceae bacterium BMA10]